MGWIPRKMVVAVAAVGLASLACGGLQPTPVPDDKQDYIGLWAGGSMSLEIEANGMATYKMSEPVNTELNAPVQAWRDDGIDIGVGPMVTSLSITKAPHEDAGAWKMTVNSVELTKQ